MRSFIGHWKALCSYVQDAIYLWWGKADGVRLSDMSLCVCTQRWVMDTTWRKAIVQKQRKEGGRKTMEVLFLINSKNYSKKKKRNQILLKMFPLVYFCLKWNSVHSFVLLFNSILIQQKNNQQNRAHCAMWHRNYVFCKSFLDIQFQSTLLIAALSKVVQVSLGLIGKWQEDGTGDG